MGHQVTIEGSLTPSVELPRGQRRTVEVTAYIRKLVQIGAVVVVDGSLTPPAAPEPEPTSDETQDDHPDEDHQPADSGPPAGNATTDEWLAFLLGKGIDIPTNSEGETPGREGLKAIWQQVHGGS